MYRLLAGEGGDVPPDITQWHWGFQCNVLTPYFQGLTLYPFVNAMPFFFRITEKKILRWPNLYILNSN